MSDNITSSPFMRHDIIDRLLANTDPKAPFPSADATNGYSTFQTIKTHLESLSAEARKQRSELLAARLHLLVNQPIPAKPSANELVKEEAVLAKTRSELEVMRVRVEMAVLAVVQASGPTSAETSVRHPGGPSEERTGVSVMVVKWKEAEAEAGMVNTECGHLIRRLQSFAGVNGRPTATTGQSVRWGSTELEPSSSSSGTSGTPAAADEKHLDMRYREARMHTRTAIQLRAAALECLILVDEHFGREGRVARWKEQLQKMEEVATP